MELTLLMNYVELEQEEMLYLDGGGVGKHFWNSRTVVGFAIDAIAIAIPILSGFFAMRKVGTLAKAGRVYIRTSITNAIKQAKLGFAVTLVSALVDFLFMAIGGSVGSWIAMGLDFADGKRDGYIYA